MRATIELAPIGIAQLGPDGRLLLANTHLHELLRLPRGELLSHTLPEIVDPADQERIESFVRQVLTGEATTLSQEARLARADGSLVHVVLTLSGVRDEDGEVAFAVVAIEERQFGGGGNGNETDAPIAATREREPDALATDGLRALENEERLRALIEASPLGIDIMDLEGNPIFYNPRAEELHGIDFTHAAGRGWEEAVHPDDRERIVRSWYEAASKGRPWAETYRFLHRDGTVVWVSGRAAPIRVAGRITGFVGTLEDIRPLKEAEQAARESEERFRTLADTIPQIVWVAEPDGVISWSNRYLREYTGSEVTALDSDELSRLIHPGHRDHVTSTIRKALAAGDLWEDTFPVRDRSGAYRWFLVRMLPVRDEVGSVIRWFGTATDVTDSIEAAERQREHLAREREARDEAENRARQEEALRAVAATVVASTSTGEVIRKIAEKAVVATRADGVLVERIDSASGEIVVDAATGTVESMMGSRIRYAGSVAQKVIESGRPRHLNRLDEERHGLTSELVRRYPDHSALSVPLVSDEDRIGAVVLLRGPDRPPFRADETRRVQAFADLATIAFRRIQLLEESERRREELQRVMESRSLLMRGFSHDVKNPLGAADGFLSLLEDGIGGEIPDRQREHVIRARRAIGRSLQLIEELLELARAEVGQIDIDWTKVAVRDALRELGEEYGVQAAAKGIDLVLDLPDELPVIVSDFRRVRQILGNLFSNAIKYTDQGHVRVAAELRSGDSAGRPGDWLVVSITDTGRGIPGDKMSLLFKEFTRLDPGDKEGAGIGLAISQRVAQALGGEITVESEAGKGSTFRLWLPRSGPHAGEQRAADVAGSTA